jgi:transposase
MKKIYVGCDISKAKIDFSIFISDTFLLHRVVENTIDALTEFLNSVEVFSEQYAKENIGSEIVFAAEYTGIYNNFLMNVIFEKNFKIALLHPYSLKAIGGINRDKNDKIDSKRIAEYAIRFYDKLQFAVPLTKSVEELKALNSLRSLLIKARTMITLSLNECKLFQNKDVIKSLVSIGEPTLGALDESIDEIDKKILLVIENDVDLKKTLKLLISVPGIGKVTATELIIYTENFTKFDSAKKLGSYCGVVPFERSSGIFKGKSKISKKANKSLKTLLHLCAMSSINTKSKFSVYYNRKLSEGKTKMCVVNALRNKLLSTAFAVIKSEKPYQENYVYTAA